MKGKNKFKNIFIILVIILISTISFGGIIIKNKNTFTNIIPEYITGMNFSGKIVFTIKPDDTVNKEYYDKDGNKVDESSIEEDKKEEYEVKEIPVNSSEVLNIDNYNKIKEIIEKRLDILDVKEFNVSLNSDDGSITVSIPDDKNTNFVISQILQKGNFKITDGQDKNTILLSEDNVKNVKTRLVNQYSQNIAVITIQFDKTGTKKLQELSKEYRGQTINVESDQENNDSDTEQKTTTKQVNLMLDDEIIISQYFTEEVKDGKIELTIGNASSNASDEDLENYLRQGRGLASFIQTEDLPPIAYVYDSEKQEDGIYSQKDYKIFLITILAISLILILFACIKYKKIGVLLMISQIGFVASLLIIIRFANVCVTETGIISIILSSLISYLFIIRLLNANKRDIKLSKVSLKTLYICIPIFIISIICTLAKYLPIQNYLSIESFGMILFYAILLMPIYHIIFTKGLIKSEKTDNLHKS